MDAVTQWLYPLLVVTVVIGLLIGIRVWIESVNLKLRGDIKDIFHVLSKAVMAGQSPFELTDLGDNISRCIGAKSWANRVAQELSGQVSGKEPYEISEFSFHYIEEQFTPDREQDVLMRRCAYENAVPRSKVLNVLAVELRDKLLELADTIDA